MILTGCIRRAEREPRAMWTTMAHGLFAFLADRFSCSSGLFYDAPAGSRRSFSSFATHTYLTLACFTYGEWSGDERALNLAKKCTAKLIELQGPQGEWPWFFYTPGGRVTGRKICQQYADHVGFGVQIKAGHRVFARSGPRQLRSGYKLRHTSLASLCRCAIEQRSDCTAQVPADEIRLAGLGPTAWQLMQAHAPWRACAFGPDYLSTV